jgi:hypothetical protein
MLTKLVITGKEHMIPQFMMADCTTGQQQEQHNMKLYEYALQRLELTTEQQQRIQATLMCFQGLLAAIMEARQALQTQLFPNGMPSGPPGGSSSSGAGPAGASAAGVPSAVGAAPMPAGPAGDNANSNAANTVSNTVSNNADAFDAGGASSAAPLQAKVEEGSISRSGSGSGSGSDERSSSSSRASDGHGSTKVALSQQQHARRELQQQHQQQLAQMFKLLKKESLLKCCCWVGVEGCMTYVQLAKLAVTCFPYPTSPIALAQAVDRMLKQQPQQPPQAEQQQQQQQQHQQSVPSSM